MIGPHQLWLRPSCLLYIILHYIGLYRFSSASVYKHDDDNVYVKHDSGHTDLSMRAREIPLTLALLLNSLSVCREDRGV